MGMTFDSTGNLWILNSQTASNSILEYTKDGKWISHHKTQLMNGDMGLWNMKMPIIDSRGLLWFVNDSWSVPALAYYNISSDTIKVYKSFINEDGTTVSPSQGVRCVTEDIENNIWVGTSAGPLMIPSSQVGTDDETFTQVKVPRNDGTNYADYLLTGVDITCIAIDGGNRKWMGTNGNGIYVISSDNMTQIHHFTSSNSKILSDIIQSISIDNTTGKVYIGTDKGLCSYMNDATGASSEMQKDNVYAYPNPVKPDYTGLITVKGLSYDADIKIVTSNGALVNEGRSNGGMYTWDGCDTDGKKVASGVYMVMAATSDGSKGVVCKIAIVR
jgi:streptogramin lyase